MGWANGNEIFDPVARKALELDLTDEQVTELLTVLIAEMQQADWDTEDESLDEFEDYPAVVEAFRRNDIIIKCGEQGDDWCVMERGHSGGVHENELGKKWPAAPATLDTGFIAKLVSREERRPGMMSWLLKAWFRLIGCGACHRTGVIMTGVCDCGRPVWSLEPHEPYCDTSRCPRGCKMTASRGEAIEVWRWYWKEAQA